MFRSSFQAGNAGQDPHHIHEKILDAAKRSGTISLSGRGLSYVPPVIWTLNSLNPAEKKPIDFASAGDDGVNWWEAEPITRLNLSGNSISELPGDGISQLDSLVNVDIRDNELNTLPEEISALVNLKQLLLSSNKITLLPSTFTKLTALVQLNLAHNQLAALPDDMANLTSLEKLEVSDNHLTQVPSSLPPSIISLDISQNRLTALPSGWLQSCPNLRDFNASNNGLQDMGLTSEPSASSLTVLNLNKNRLQGIPNFTVFPKLIDLSLGDNRITSFQLEGVRGLKDLTTLELSRNRISVVPDGIPAALPNLCRLSLSNNDITVIPTELGFMDSLEVLSLSGNPLRSIPQSVLTGGTQTLKDLLKERHKPENTQVSPKPAPLKVEATAVVEVSKPNPYDSLPVVNANTGVLDWGKEKKQNAGTRFARSVKMDSDGETPLPPLDDQDLWKSVALKGCNPNVEVKTVNLSTRQLVEFPLGILAFQSSLMILNLSHNKLTKLPEEIGLFSKLEELNVSFNALTALPEALSKLASLATLNMNFNPGLGPELPCQILFEEPLRGSLREISAAGCRLTHLPKAEFISKERMPQLTSFDVSDNDIGVLEPELGLCTQIQNLRLTGNTFRIPRPAVVSKGTAAVLEYLRSRIAQ
ncbi:hypothetical protein Aperf_G00000123998 [Anoplocephala perfoliata]